MPKFFLLLCFLINLGVFKAQAQAKSDTIFEIRADTASSFWLKGRYIKRFDDQSGKLTIDDVSGSVITAKFKKIDVKKNEVNENINAYWLRFRVKNTMTKPVRLMLYANAGIIDYYMALPNGKWLKQRAGSDSKWDERGGFKRYNAVYYELQPGQEALFYKRFYFDDYAMSSVAGDSGVLLVNAGYYDGFVKNRLAEKQYYSTTLGSWASGFMMLAGMISLVIYVLIKDKLYLYFAVIIICISLLNNDILSAFFFKNSPILTRYIGDNLLSSILVFYFWRFFDLFFEFRRAFPRTNKVVLWFGTLIAIFGYLAGFIPVLNAPGFNYIAVTYVAVVLILILFCFIHPKTRSRHRTLTVLPIIAAVIYSLLVSLYEVILKVTVNREYIGFVFLVCTCWLIVSFIWILLNRLINTIKDTEAERNLLIKEQNTLLEIKVSERTAELNASIATLKTTQRQLIQSEKMASLGELTAGIAHEIQNPLNFINNFADVSTELIGEMNGEFKAGHPDEAMLIAADIETNLHKITTHGKRADAIVKGMLQHSRTGSDKKDLADINALCDEYLRLSFHGLRAKDKSFNAQLDTHFARDVPKLNLVPQDIGRVLLNLFNNAFYSVMQKKKLQDGFNHIVSITTSLQDNFVEIKVRDNGMGIPQGVVDKIYQPFFTTKPTGEGTGLGLSLSYDIVTNLHQGQLLVNTIEREFAEFIVRIPVQ